MLDEPAAQPGSGQSRVPSGDARMAFALGVGQLDAPEDLDKIDVVDEEPKLGLTVRAIGIPAQRQTVHATTMTEA